MKARVLLWEDCNRACKGCCNKDWDLSTLPTITIGDMAHYEQVIFTGGEPMLYPETLLTILHRVRDNYPLKNLIMYTADCSRPFMLVNALRYLNGLTFTLHNNEDVVNFYTFTQMLPKYIKESRSLRLNVFRGVDMRHLDTSYWIVKPDMVWIKDCPLPKDEVFMRYDSN